jgi:hypothetical protein
VRASSEATTCGEGGVGCELADPFRDEREGDAGACRVRILSTPAAQVELDGRRLASPTPLTVRLCGSYAIKLSRPGFRTHSQRVTASPGTSSLRVTLEEAGTVEETPRPAPVRFELSVDSVPPGAALQVNGRKVGTTPIQMRFPEATEVRLQLSAPGYKRWVGRANVADATQIHVRLEPELPSR